MARSEKANGLTAPVSFQSSREVFGQALPARNLCARKDEPRFSDLQQNMGSIAVEDNHSANLTLGLVLRFHDLSPIQCWPFGLASSSRRCCFRDSTNSRTSCSATSLTTANFWLISSTMADSVAPVSRSSRIREPTKLRLNIWPCRISRTMAPSWPCVLRIPSETLYIGSPTSSACKVSRNVWAHCDTLQ